MESVKVDNMDIEGAQRQIDGFANKWSLPLFKLCNNDQKYAIWYLWIRYLLSLRSLRHLAALNDVSGCFVLARCCLEYDVGISAIINDSTLGEKYIGYDPHAKNKFLKAMQHSKTEEEIADIQQYMINQFGPDFPKKTASNWYGGFTNLCEKAGRESELGLYIAYCQITHGTITGMQMLNIEGLLTNQKVLNAAYDLLAMYTLKYLKVTDQVIKVIYTEVWSPTKDACLKEHDDIATAIALPSHRS